MSFVVLAACLVVIAYRRRARDWRAFAVPCGLGALVLVGSIFVIMSLMKVFDAVSRVAPADKSTMLSEGIAEAMVSTWPSLLFSVLGVAAAVVVDVVLRQRDKG